MTKVIRIWNIIEIQDRMEIGTMIISGFAMPVKL